MGYAIRFEDCTSKETKIKCQFNLFLLPLKLTSSRHDGWRAPQRDA